MLAKRLSTPFLAITATVLILLLFAFRGTENVFRIQSPFRRGGKARSGSGLMEDVYNSTFGFEKIFVISLPSRTDRRDAITLAAALSGMEFEFINGLSGQDVPVKAIPSGPGQQPMPGASIGSWRGHMNAVREIVKRNLTSALILEDDVDWDVRIKDQLWNFALSSQALQTGQASHPGAQVFFEKLSGIGESKFSPYGGRWDLLWLGHCGMNFPFADNKLIPKGRVILEDDETVPETQHITTWTTPDELVAQYPNHTRVVHHAQEALCSWGYGLTQRGARQMLYQIGLKTFDDAFDILLRGFCEDRMNRGYHTCLTLQPALFQNHEPAGPAKSTSDISDHGEEYLQSARTPNIRWSTRMNVESLMGMGEVVDQFPDVE